MSVLKNTEFAGKNPQNQPVFYYGWIVLICCFFIALACITVRNSFGVFFKSIELEFEISRAATSGLMSVAQLVGCLVCILNGWMADRYGPRKVLIVDGILTFLGMFLTSRVTHLWQLYISYSLLVALGAGGINTIILSTVSKWFTVKRSLALAVVTASASMGLVLSTAISYLIAAAGWQNAFWVLALITIAVWLPGMFLVKNISYSAPDIVPAGLNRTTTGSHSGGYSYLQAVQSSSFWLCVSIWFLQGICHIMVQTHIVPAAVDTGISSVKASTILGLMGISNLTGRLSMGRLADRYNKKNVVIVCSVLISIAMLWLLWSAKMWQLYLFAVVFGFGFGGVVPAITATIAEIFGIQRLGTIMGSLDASLGVGAAIGPVLAGYLFDLRHSYFLAFLFAFICISITIGLILRLKPQPIEPVPVLT